MGWFDSSDRDDDDDKDDKGSSSSSSSSGERDRSFGAMGDHQSYGMDKDTFDNTIGKDRDYGSDRDSGDRDIIDSVTDFVSESWDSLTDTIDDAWQDTKDWVTGKEEPRGFSPMGGAASYGMSQKAFDSTVGKARYEALSLDKRLGREIDYLQEDPLSYASDFLDNPLVNAGMMASGLGLTSFGIRAIDAIIDYSQGKVSPSQTLRSLAGKAVSSTPIGAALGPMRQTVAEGIEDLSSVAPNLAGYAGTQFGGGVVSSVVGGLSNNPYARAAITAAGAVGAGAYAKKVVSEAQATSKGVQGVSASDTSLANQGVMADRGSDRDSPLVSSGRRAVQSSKQLMQPVKTDLYAQTVQQLPFYGLGNPQQQLPFYGLS